MKAAIDSIDRRVRSAGAVLERRSGIPAFASLSGAIALSALIPGLIAGYVDIANHLENGRDDTIFTSGHIFALVGLGFTLLAAIVSLWLYPQTDAEAGGKDGASRGVGGLRALGRRWPMGGLIALTCVSFTFIGFPFDFMWHEAFGEDATLWGPTHLQLLAGGTLSVIGFAMLMFEARRMPDWRPNRLGNLLLVGAVVSGPLVLGIWQAEWDYGAPQFQALIYPVIIAMITGGTFVFARLLIGRGGALTCLAFWVIGRAVIVATVGPVMGYTEPRFFPYAAEAVLVELAFLVFARRPASAAVLSGILVGTGGVAATFAFSRVWSYHELPWQMLPKAAAVGTLGAIGAAGLALAVARVMAPDLLPDLKLRRPAIALAGIAVLVAIAIPAPRDGVKPYVADIGIQRVGDGATAYVTTHFDDPGAVRGADWFETFAWQGGGRVLAPMRPTGAPGTYRSAVPVPITGEWKALIRVADANVLRAAPIHFGPDTFVKKPAVEATDRTNFAFRQESYYMMREYQGGSRALEAAGYVIVAALWAMFMALIVWLLARVAASEGGGPRPPRDRYRRAWPRMAVSPGT